MALCEMYSVTRLRARLVCDATELLCPVSVASHNGIQNLAMLVLSATCFCMVQISAGGVDAKPSEKTSRR